MKILNKIYLKMFITIFIIFTLLTFGGCTKHNEVNSIKVDDEINNLNQSKIYKTNLTKNEESLIEGTGCSDYFVFDVELEENFEWSEFWVDAYEFGEKKRLVSKLGCLINRDNSSFRIMLTVHDTMDKKEKLVLYAGSCSCSIIENNTTENMITTRQSASANDVNIIEGKEIPIAVILQKEGSEIRVVSEDLFTNKEQYLENLEINNHSYVLKCKFYKEKPHKNEKG